jgi:tetratricopeptide (TPR) repeat protein
MHWRRMNRLILRGLAAATMLAAAMVVSSSAAPSVPSSASSKSQTPAPFSLDDAPEPFVPKAPETEANRDRIHAMAIFATGRALERRQELPAALQRYQRALRYDPRVKGIAEAVVDLATQLKRSDERNRYLLRAGELDPENMNTAELIDLTDIVDRKDTLHRVIALFEKVVAIQTAKKQEKKSPVETVLQWRLAELHVLDEQYAKAAACADRVMEALRDPKQFGLDDQLMKQLLSGPRPPQVVFAEYYLLAKQPDKAEAAFREADRLAPKPNLLEYELARVDAQRGKHAEAIARLEKCFDGRLTGQGVEPYELLAELLDKLKRKGELTGKLERLLALDPDNAPLAYFLADQYRQAGQLEKARVLYVKALAAQPSSVGYTGLAEIYRKTDRTEDLLRLLGNAAGKVGSLEPLEQEAKTIAADAALVNKLADAAKKSLAKDPKALGPDVALGMALMATRAKRFELVEEFFNLALRATPDETSDLLLVWGGALLAEGKYAEAAAVFRRGLDPKTPADDQATCNYYLSTALEMDGKTDVALDAARKAVALKKDSPRLIAQVAWVLYHAKRNDKAIEAYSELVGKFDSDHATPGLREITREARLILANLHVIEGHAAEAVERIEQVLDEFPDDISAMNDLGYLWADRKEHLQRALGMVRAAVDAEPENAAYRDSLGWALFRLGRLDEAAAELQRAADKDKSEGEILEHLGEVLAAMNQPAKAEDAWRKAAEAFQKAKKPDRAKKVETRLQQLTKSKP